MELDLGEVDQSPVLPKLRVHFRIENDHLLAEGDLNAILDRNNIDRVYYIFMQKI